MKTLRNRKRKIGKLKLLLLSFIFSLIAVFALLSIFYVFLAAEEKGMGQDISQKDISFHLSPALLPHTMFYNLKILSTLS